MHNRCTTTPMQSQWQSHTHVSIPLIVIARLDPLNAWQPLGLFGLPYIIVALLRDARPIRRQLAMFIRFALTS